jgi:hypothetical protein
LQATTRSASRVLGRHYRVLPQRLVDVSLAWPRHQRSARGKNADETVGRAAHPALGPRPEGVGSSFSGVVASELDTRPELTGSFEAGGSRLRSVNRSSRAACRPARRRGDERMASPRTAWHHHRGDDVARASRCRTPPKRRATQRSAPGPFLATWPPRWSGRSGGLTEACLAVAVHRSGVVARDTQRENDDTSHGVRHPSAKSVQVVVMPVYLADTLRPRSFSLPRRLDPTWTSWLCFAPLPPMGFRPSELFPLSQPQRLSVPVALLPLD